jgi:hypothetical protein
LGFLWLKSARLECARVEISAANYRHQVIHRKGTGRVGWHIDVGARGIAESLKN